MNVFRTLDAHLQRNLLVLFTAGLLFWSSLASLLPTLPLYIEDVGATKQQIGLVMGCFAIGLLLFRSLLGRLADQHSRKIVLLIGMSAVAIAPLGYIMVQSIPLLMVIRAFHGISIAAFTTGYSALVADIAPVRNRGEVIGYMSLVNPIGLALGPALGGYLQAWAGYTPLFLLSAGLGILGLCCTAQVLNPQVSIDQQVKTLDNQFWRLLSSPRVRVPAIVLLLVGLTFGTMSTFVPLFIKSVGVELNAGLFYTAAAIASFSVRLIAGRASDRYGRGLFITISLIFYTVAMLFLWTANSASMFLLAATLEGIGAGILIPMVAAILVDRAMPQERGRIFGVCMVGFDLGIAIAGPVLGLLAEQVGYRNMFGFAAGLTFLAIIIFLTQSSKDLPHSLRFALGRGRDVYALNRS
ncbi:MFS transporter [Chroococcidiopsis sp. CCMEE 29]|uniref:MFS transporter n=1 Tax=Chroococcidiopsis sp. CCMEE 29 TaxID=155894 RepID=UPI002020C032|nr:MFS transporter [Chroococcidiopsis sp. CCMEE 29]